MSTCDPDFHVGDIGAILVHHIKEPDPANPGALRDKDVSASTTLEIRIRKPDMTTVTTFPAVIATAAEGAEGDGTDGKIKITTTSAGDLDQSGDYTSQSFVATGASPMQHAASRSFLVGEVL